MHKDIMACTILTQICINDKISINNQKPIDKPPELIKVSEKQLRKVKISIENFLTGPDKSELLQLKLGKLRFNLQLKEKNFTDKFLVSQNVSEYFSQDQNEINLKFGSKYPKLDSLDFNEFDELIDDYSLVFKYIVSNDTVKTVKSIINLANNFEAVVASVDERIRKVLKELKEFEKPSEQNFNGEIKKIRDDIEELSFQMGLVKSNAEKDTLQMEISRKSCKINELRSQNILALSESRCRLYQNSLNSQGTLNHLRTRSFASQQKPPSSEPVLKQNIQILTQDLKSLQSLIPVLSQSLSSLTPNPNA